MNDNDTPGEELSEFKREANRPRDGWSLVVGILDHPAETWTRWVSGLALTVIGIAAEGGTGAGCWRFIVKDGDQVLTSGESSRRGWAMDGADDAARPVLH